MDQWQQLNQILALKKPGVSANKHEYTPTRGKLDFDAQTLKFKPARPGPIPLSAMERRAPRRSPPQSLPREDQCTQKISVMEILRDARMVVWPKVAQTKLRLFCVRACCRCYKPFMVRVVDEVILVSLVPRFSWTLSNIEVYQ